MSNLLQRQKVSVSTKGTLVTLRIGNIDIDMEYELALQLSTWMRVKGKEAKRNAGDTSRHWSVVGNLRDVLQGGRPW